MTDSNKTSPKHGSSPQGNPDANRTQENQSQPSMSQADGTAANAPRGETQAQPQKKESQAKSETPENRAGQINPSAPNDGTSGMPANTTRDSAGEVGEPTGQGNLDAPKENEQPGEGAKKEEVKKAEEAA